MVTVAPGLLASLASLLEYPSEDLAARIASASAGASEHAEAARRIDAFATWVAATPRGRIEEVYTAALDLDPSCSPYVGQRLLGGDPRRGLFMARLAARYRARGFSPGSELPDHLAVMLRFLSHAPDDPDADELVADCVAPAAASLAGELTRREHPYAPVAEAVALVVGRAAAEKEAPR